MGGILLPLKGQVHSLGALLALDLLLASVAQRPYIGIQLLLARTALDEVYLRLPLKTAWKLQLEHNMAARILTGIASRYLIIPILTSLICCLYATEHNSVCLYIKM